jgi:Phage Terminase
MTVTLACPPRIATPRTVDRATYGEEVATVARALGWELMPHQRHVLDVGLEITEDGRFAYRDITITEPRQGGKSVRLFSLACWRATLYAQLTDTAQLIAYSAQSGFEARRKMLDDWAPILRNSELAEHLVAMRRGAGHEVFEFDGGSRMQPIANTTGSAHGRVLDLAMLDEAFDDVDDRREQAVVPAMATRANAQLWVNSTAGTDDALYFKRKVETGRKLALDGVTEGSAFFEWSAPEDVDIDDESTWASFMPALGQLIPIEAVRHAHRTMPSNEFARAFGNRWTSSEVRIIPWAEWLACRDPKVELCGALHLSVDAPPDRASACIVIAASDGNAFPCEVVEHRGGMGWVCERVAQLIEVHDIRSVTIHGGGPIGTLAAELDRTFPHLLHVATDAEMTFAAGTMLDAITEQRLRVRVNPLIEHLSEAVAGARKRMRQDAFTWARRSPKADLSPLVAASLAVWRASNDAGGALWIYS